MYIFNHFLRLFIFIAVVAVILFFLKMIEPKDKDGHDDDDFNGKNDEFIDDEEKMR
ncbi:MAG: hypothetical protein Q8907_03000 [Bacteroidota bacterium]|nr:hypothetical protein [Bacteroidota bacterium]MDP4226661.1 hypothetical protein [Bacteroidota bacterium]MDP4273228.1 hypothetical protein [Bacteroidota bacterium]